jgi:hypothetical protein
MKAPYHFSYVSGYRRQDNAGDQYRVTWLRRGPRRCLLHGLTWSVHLIHRQMMHPYGQKDAYLREYVTDGLGCEAKY